MKAITLVDEMPSKCHGCPYDDFDFRCKLTGFDHEDYVMRGTRDVRCPLKPMPEKEIHDPMAASLSYPSGYVDGRNSVIKEILGETK